MTCEQYGLYLSKYVDDELTLEERKTVEDHLSSCSECRGLLAQFFHNDEVLSNALAGKIFGSEVVNSIMDQVRKDQGIMFGFRRATRRVWGGLAAPGFRFWWAAAAILLVAVAVVTVEPIRKLIPPLSTVSDAGAEQRYRDENNKLRDDLLVIKGFIDQERLSRMTWQIRRVPIQNIIAYVPPSIEKPGIYVRAEFANKHNIKSYSVYRRDRASGPEPATDPLKTDLYFPEYYDEAVVPGVTYEYWFEAVNRDGSREKSKSINHVSPAVPDDAIEIELLDISENTGQAWFIITKMIDGKTKSDATWVALNEPVGKHSTLAGIDFSTGYSLIGLGTDIQYVQTKELEPKVVKGERFLDAQGEPEMIERITHRRIGPNQYADLKAPDGRVLKIFCGENKRIP